MEPNNSEVSSNANTGKANEGEAPLPISDVVLPRYRLFFADCEIGDDERFTFQRYWPSVGKKISLSPTDYESWLSCIEQLFSIPKETLDKFDGSVVRKKECPLVDDLTHKITFFIERSAVNDYVYRVEIKEYDSLGFYLPDVDYDDKPRADENSRGRGIPFKHDIPIIPSKDHGFWILRGDSFPPISY